MSEKLYIAGPMSGYPQFNFPAFQEAATTLRGQGMEILSPAEMDDPETVKLTMASAHGVVQTDLHGLTWGDFLARDVKIVADIATGVVVLHNWERSKGARLEVANALSAG